MGQFDWTIHSVSMFNHVLRGGYQWVVSFTVNALAFLASNGNGVTIFDFFFKNCRYKTTVRVVKTPVNSCYERQIRQEG